MALVDGEVTERIIAAAIAVHRALGPGFLESVYEEALAIELEADGIAYERQKPVQIICRERPVGEHRLDLYVGGVVVELKAVKDLDPVFFATVRSLNFAAMPLTIKRVSREASSRE